MKRIKNIIMRIICLPFWATALICLPSFALVIYALTAVDISPVLCYVAYALSAYALVIAVSYTVRLSLLTGGDWRRLPVVVRIAAHPVGRRYMNDRVFRATIGLFIGFVSGVGYAAINLVAGLVGRSLWFCALAGYYLLLVLLRYLLLRRYGREDLLAEYRRHRLCGILLLLMNQALVVMVVLMVWEDRFHDYPGVLIYAMAAYAFFNVSMAMVHLVRYRRQGDPLLSAVKTVRLTAAMVSLLSLETALLARFGEDNTPTFRRAITGATGALVCAAVLIMAIDMIVQGTRRIRAIKTS